MALKRKMVVQWTYNNFGIETKNMTYWYKLQDVQLRGTVKGCCIDMDIMNEIGIRHELLEIIMRMRQETLFFTHLDVYEDLVYEFYNSLLVPINERKNIIEYTISLRMKRDDYKVEPKKFVE